MEVNYTELAANERPVKETMNIYTKWASKYDEDMETNGLEGANAVVKIFSQLRMEKSLRILDLGAGTGKIGVLLKGLGYENVDGLDGCQEMLDIAKSKDAYQQYIQAIVSKEKPLPITDNSYDVAIMGGVMAPGHFGPDFFSEFIRIVKPGGIVCWAMRDPKLYSHKSDIFKGDHFQKRVDHLCEMKLWKYHVPGPIAIPNYNVNFSGYGYIMDVI